MNFQSSNPLPLPYLSHQTVYFDNLKVRHYQGLLQGEFHYYPFGGSLSLSRGFNAGKQPQLFTNQTFERNEFGDGNGLYLYDFEARMYDVQIGRWWGVDPLISMYVNITPYSYVANIPTNYRDADGQIIVDSNGNPVSVIINEGSENTMTSSFGFVEGTSQDVIENFKSTSGEIINSLIQVTTGLEQVSKAIDSSDKINLTISQEIKRDANGVTLGGTILKPNYIKDGAGNKIGVETIIEVTIYQGSINEVQKPPTEGRKIGKRQQEFLDNQLNNSQKIGSIAAHELEHATNPVDVGNLKQGKNISTYQHKVAINKGSAVAKEFGLKNKK